MSKQGDFSEVGRAVEKRIERGILPGALLCVNIGGERVYEYCAGYADFRTRSPLKKDAIFRLASMTKPVTAAAVLIQQDRGLLSVTDKVCSYLPEMADRRVGRLDEGGEVVFWRNANRDMTIEDVLTHSSGLGSGPVGDAQFARCGRSERRTPAEMMEAYSGMYLDFSPGTSQLYSAFTALDLAVRIVELTSGTDYESFLRKNILDPLEMPDTGYRLDGERRKRLVSLCRLSDTGDRLEETEIGFAGHQGFPEGCVSGATCLMGTMEDYSHFAEMLCGEGVWRGNRILSREAVRAMRTPHFEMGFAGMNEFFNWGYCVRVTSREQPGVQELTPSSYGWSGAYNTHFWVDPVRKVTGLFLSNMDNAGGAGAPTAFEFECNVMRSLGKEK